MSDGRLPAEEDFLGDRYFMQAALAEARVAYQKDEVPVGAVITWEGKIIAKAHNQVETLKDPTAHAEMIAITQATNALSSKWLYECTMYVTLEPCSMCAGALVLSRLKRLVFGARDPKAGGCCSVFNITNSGQLNHRIQCQDGLLGENCARLLTDFFAEKRKKADS
ncbi:MAG: tRNA adenosine(34) deaminase TadA [Candidatus Omnitrophica bacterium]|nr:tRNA adenosine(34) deaminase TadA [Candidatus Omnitrophota bacterium]